MKCSIKSNETILLSDKNKMFYYVLSWLCPKFSLDYFVSNQHTQKKKQKQKMKPSPTAKLSYLYAALPQIYLSYLPAT